MKLAQPPLPIVLVLGAIVLVSLMSSVSAQRRSLDDAPAVGGRGAQRENRGQGNGRPAAGTSPVTPSFDAFTSASPQFADACIGALNRRRAAAGIPALSLNPTMSKLAARHAAYMASTEGISHDGFWSFRFDGIPNFGVGEMVASDRMRRSPNGAAQRTVELWFNSPPHNEMMMRADLTQAGCSIVTNPDGRWYASSLLATAK